MPAGDSWGPVVWAAIGMGLLRLIDILLPKGRHLKALDRWLTPTDSKESEDEERR